MPQLRYIVYNKLGDLFSAETTVAIATSHKGIEVGVLGVMTTDQDKVDRTRKVCVETLFDFGKSVRC
jgi:hypothetical protein